DWGTRLMATFTNVPPNVTIYVSVRNDAPPPILNVPSILARLTATDANGAGPFSGLPGNGTFAALTPSGGTATAVWDVLRTPRLHRLRRRTQPCRPVALGKLQPDPHRIHGLLHWRPSAHIFPTRRLGPPIRLRLRRHATAQSRNLQ